MVQDERENETHFKIKASTPLGKLMDAYCSRHGLHAHTVHFSVNGMGISPEDTADKVGLEVEGIIHVANIVDVAGAAGENAEDTILLKVRSDRRGEVIFKINRSSPLERLMSVYCTRKRLFASLVHFTLNGTRISPEDTAENLGLATQDTIHAIVEQSNGDGHADDSSASTTVAQEAAQCVFLTVKDDYGSELVFKIKTDTPLHKLMSAYCSRKGLQAWLVEFSVRGVRISPEDTAEKLGLEDKSVIDAAGTSATSTVERSAAEKRAAEEPASSILVVIKGKDHEVHFRIKKSTPLQNLMDAYCRQKRLQASAVEFSVNGVRISPDETAEKLGLEDSGIIDVAGASEPGMELQGSNTENPLAEAADAALSVSLTVKDRNGTELFFKIKRLTRLGRLMEAYCSRNGLNAPLVEFSVNGVCISPDDTVEALGLEDGSVIDAAGGRA